MPEARYWCSETAPLPEVRSHLPFRQCSRQTTLRGITPRRANQVRGTSAPLRRSIFAAQPLIDETPARKTDTGVNPRTGAKMAHGSAAQLTLWRATSGLRRFQMKVLVLGGTLFLGRAIVDQALANGHEVTLFNRGRTNPDLFNGVENLIGDRNSDLTQLRGRIFDAVIDTSGYFPRQVQAVIDALEGNIAHYTFVSTTDVYADHSIPGRNENAELATVTDLDDEQSGDNYGGFKALSEATLDAALPGRVHHVRAGLIVGPHDNSGRFTYWVKRIAAGGEVLAPEPRDQPVQFIDVRDLAQWILHAASNQVTGAMNASASPGSMTMESVLNTINAQTGNQANLTWVGEEFLVSQGVKPWSQLPLWLPPASFPTHAGRASRNTSLAIKHGLVVRPLSDTVQAVREDLENRLQNAQGGTADGSGGAGLTLLRESELLSLWREQAGPDRRV